ncbi:MAG: hypothetical protein N3A57_05020 [Negativicutes bacterium]|nr:hypothetical protein [Negativicutes bacterium]
MWGKTCLYCQSPVKPADQTVAYPLCGIVHHCECWADNEGCTTYGCEGEVEIDRTQVDSCPRQKAGFSRSLEDAYWSDHWPGYRRSGGRSRATAGGRFVVRIPSPVPPTEPGREAFRPSPGAGTGSDATRWLALAVVFLIFLVFLLSQTR